MVFFRPVLKFTLRLALLYFLFLLFYTIGALFLAVPAPAGSGTGGSPPAVSEPGLVSPAAGLLIVALVNLVIIVPLIRTSRWGGWKLALLLALSYYGTVTFVVQLESAFFLTASTVDAQTLPRLFLMGLPPAFCFLPLAVRILGKKSPPADPTPNSRLVMPVGQWLWKLTAIVAAYLILYWLAGYFIAWQNPAVRAFYGQPGPALPFWEHTLNTLRNSRLFALQILRALLWVLCMLPVIRGAKLTPWRTALLAGAFLSLLPNIALILENPLMPSATVRLTHLLETTSSNFLWGLFMVWLLHRRHHSLADLFGVRALLA